MENREDIIDIDPVLILKRVLKYVWVILTVGIVFGIAAYMWNTIMVVPKYKSSTKVYVLNNNINEKKLTTQDFQIGNYLLKDYKEIILSSKVLERVIEKNGIQMNLVDLRSKIEVKIPQDTRILTITVEDTDSKRAADLANAVRDEAFLEIKEITKEESVNILEKAQESKTPSSPDIRKNTIMAIGIGILLSLAVVILKEVLDDRVKKQEDIEEGLRNGSFRNSSTNKNNKEGGSKIMKEKMTVIGNRVVHNKVEEYYNKIRTNIQFSGPNIKVIVITSVQENEGKSLVSLNLAISFAKLEKRVLLLDADIRNSVMAARIKFNRKIEGFTSYLSGQTRIEDNIYETEIENLHIIPSGKYSPNPTNLLQNNRVDLALEVFREFYDIIIIDTAPIGLVIDAALLAQKADASILVVESGRTPRKLVRKAKRDLEQTNTKFLGIILNKVNEKELGYGDYGGYRKLWEYK